MEITAHSAIRISTDARQSESRRLDALTGIRVFIGSDAVLIVDGARLGGTPEFIVETSLYGSQNARKTRLNPRPLCAASVCPRPHDRSPESSTRNSSMKIVGPAHSHAVSSGREESDQGARAAGLAGFQIRFLDSPAMPRCLRPRAGWRYSMLRPEFHEPWLQVEAIQIPHRG